MNKILEQIKQAAFNDELSKLSAALMKSPFTKAFRSAGSYIKPSRIARMGERGMSMTNNAQGSLNRMVNKGYKSNTAESTLNVIKKSSGSINRMLSRGSFYHG